MKMEKIISQAYKDVGRNKSCILCIEELAELQDAVAAMLIGDRKPGHLCEEIADVGIHLEYVKKALKISDKQVKEVSNSDNAFFELYISELDQEDLYLTAIREMALLQIVLTKYIRGKSKPKKHAIDKIAKVERYIKEIMRREDIQKKYVSDWSCKKKKRLKHRTKKHKVF